MSKKPLVSKATVEFAITLFAAAILFSIVNIGGFLEKIYVLPVQQRPGIHKLLICTGFFAAAMIIFALRRWIELRRAYRELAKSEERLRFQAMLLDEIGDSVTATDLEGKITYVNQTQCNWVKRSKDELIGKSVKAYDLDDTIESTQQEIIKTTLETGKWSGEIINTAADGNKIIVDCHTWLMKGKNGKPTGMCGVARNITEKKEHELELQKHKRYLEALDTVASVLLHSISKIPYEEFLGALGRASGVDRVLVILKKIDRNGRISTPIEAQWSETVTPIVEQTHNFFLENVWSDWEKVLTSNEPVCLLTSHCQPDDRRKFWNSMGIKALLALPIIIDEKFYGLISFDNCTKERQWTASEIEFLRTAANDLASAMKRLEIKYELKQQRDFAQKLIETAQTIVLVLDKDANIVTFNPYLEKLTGYQLEEVKGKNWFDTFLSEKDRKKMREVFAAAASDVPTKGNINPIVTKDGRLRYIEWFDKTLKDENGKTAVLLATGQDITERKRAEELLRESEERYRLIFNGITDAVFVHRISDDNMPGKFLAVNDIACRRLGYSREEFLRMSPADIDARESTTDVRSLIEKLKLGENVLFEQNHVAKDGRRIPVEINAQSFLMQGCPLVLSVVRDITERKRAEEELKKAHSELEQKVVERTAELQKINIQLLKTIEERNRIQKLLQETEKLAAAGKLAAQIAHEINNPMAGIKNSFLLIKDAIDINHRYFEYVGRIEKEIDRVSQIVKQMFDLYRPDAAPARQFNLYDTIKDIVELLKVAWQEKQINIEIECSPKTAVTLSEALLRQIIFNIVQNAIQASNSDATVKINGSADDGRLNLSVSDRGPGIDDEIKDRIFEPFFTTGIGGPKSGLGLGLAITKDIVSAMDGTISFISEKNKGTVFNISIPVGGENASLK